MCLIHKKTQKNKVKFSEFGITKFNLVVFTISQWDLVLQLSFLRYIIIFPIQKIIISHRFQRIIFTKLFQSYDISIIQNYDIIRIYASCLTKKSYSCP